MRVEVRPFDESLWPTLEPVWRQLGSAEPSCFLGVSWTEAWLAEFGGELRPTGLVWRASSGEPVGCALVSIRWAKVGPFPVRRAYLNTSGAGTGCEHNDVLAEPSRRASVLDDLVRYVVREDVDEFALVGVRESLMRELLSRWPGRGYEGHLSESPYVDLTRLRTEAEDHLSVISPGSRAQIRRSVRLYQDRFGPPSIGWPANAAEATEWFGAMVRLHRESWQARGEQGAFEDIRIREFHLRMLRRGVEKGLSDGLRPEILRVSFGSEVIGYLYNLRYRGAVSFYQSGLAYDDDNRYKPGLVAHALAVEHYRDLGESEYDFLGGEPTSVRYKNTLATDHRMLAWVQLPRPSYKMRALRALRHARRRARAALKRA